MLKEINKEKINRWETGKFEYPFGRGINFQLEIDNLEEIYKKLKTNNYDIKIDIEENWYRQDDKLLGNKEFLVMNPEGYLLRFFEYLGEK